MEISQIERRPRTRLDGLGFITFRDGKEEEDGLAMPRRGCRGRGDGRTGEERKGICDCASCARVRTARQGQTEA